MENQDIKNISIFKKIIIKLRIFLFGKIKYKDKFGLSYFLWPNTRPIDTYQRGVRTDDETLLQLVLRITKTLNNTNKPTVCFDVGGFMGIVTLTMLKGVNGNGIVHTFEPVRRNHARIVKNVELNGFSNAVINNMAVSNYSGLGLHNLTHEGGDDFLQKLNNDSGNLMGENIILDKDLSRRDMDTDVSSKQLTLVMSLHKYMDTCSIDWVDILKVDAEFTDHLVLQGAQEHFYNHHFGFILIEYNKGDGCAEELLNMLLDADYKIYYMVRNTGQLVKNLKDYPKECKKCLNIMAVSNNISDDICNEIIDGLLI
jgi:FkbM family methyltransferase